MTRCVGLPSCEAAHILGLVMARDELQKRIAEMNKRPMRNVPTEENSEIGGLRRKLKKQADAKLAKMAEEKVIFPLSEAPDPAAISDPSKTLSPVVSKSRNSTLSGAIRSVLHTAVTRSTASPAGCPSRGIQHECTSHASGSNSVAASSM